MAPNGATATPGRGRTSGRSRVAWTLWAAAFVAAIVLGVVLAVVAVGTFVPGLGVLSVLAALIVATFTPVFAIAGALVLLVGLVGLRKGFRKRGLAAAVLGGSSLLANGVAIALVLIATGQAGGSVNLLRATFGLQQIGGASPDLRVVYGQTPAGEDLRLSIYRPSAKPRSAPVIMYVHGGGWTTGTADQLSSEFRNLADAGYLVVSVQYELSTPTRHTWNRTPRQVNCAAAWIAKHAEDLGGNLDKLAYWGDSAGGNLAINAAYSAAAGTATSSCGDLPKPRAVIGDFPAVDVSAVYDSDFDLPGISAHTYATNYLGGTPTRYPKRYAAVGSARFLSKNAPDTLLIVPKRDSLVPPATTYEWAREARRAGASVDVAKIPLAMHVYSQQAYNSVGSQAHLSIAKNYLAKRLK